MRVFILCTGRTGSSTFAKACQHISNYTSGHETLTKKLGDKRFAYPNWHIEADNRLSWHLGTLNKKFPDDVFYVHFTRNQNQVVSSYAKRYFQPGSIVDAYCNGIKKTPPEKLNNSQRIQACEDYVVTINDNIENFIENKANSMSIDIENIKEDFPVFWEKIGAIGNLSKALEEFEIKYNASQKRKHLLQYRLKLFLLRTYKRFLLNMNS